MSQVTVRIEYQHFQQSDKAYRFVIDNDIVWLPKGSVAITENGKFLDLDMPKWLAVKNGLKDEIVAEY